MAAGGAAAGGGVAGAVADERTLGLALVGGVGALLGRGAGAGALLGAVLLTAGAATTVALALRPVAGLAADGDQRHADAEHRAGLGVQPRDHAGGRARDVDRGLGGLDRDDLLVDLDLVTHGDVPGHDLGLGQPLAEVGQREDVRRGAHPRTPEVRSAPEPAVAAYVRSGSSSHCSRSMVSRIRSTPGRCECSRIGGG